MARNGSTSSVRKHQINKHWDKLNDEEKKAIDPDAPNISSKGKTLPIRTLKKYIEDEKKKF